MPSEDGCEILAIFLKLHFVYIFFICVDDCLCRCLCILHVLVKAIRGLWILWEWSYTYVFVAMRVQIFYNQKYLHKFCKCSISGLTVAKKLKIIRCILQSVHFISWMKRWSCSTLSLEIGLESCDRCNRSERVAWDWASKEEFCETKLSHNHLII